MAREAIIFEADRTGYSIEQMIDNACTVGELIEVLSSFDEDTLFILRHDRGYTYGSIDIYGGELGTEDEDGEWTDNGYDRW